MSTPRLEVGQTAPAFTLPDADGNPNTGATFGLLFIIWASSLLCCIGTVLTVSRTYWALARDNAVPASRFFSLVNESLSCPIPATLFVGTSQI